MKQKIEKGTLQYVHEFYDSDNKLSSRWHYDLTKYMMGISNYDEAFYLMIENLLYIHYGEWKTDIILWWVYDRFGPEGEIMPIELNNHDDNTKESVIVETAEQLWNFLKRIDKLEK